MVAATAALSAGRRARGLWQSATQKTSIQRPLAARHLGLNPHWNGRGLRMVFGPTYGGSDYRLELERRLQCTILGISLSIVALLALTATNRPVAAAPSFDGDWSVVIITEAGECDRAYRYPVKVVKAVDQLRGRGRHHDFGTRRSKRYNERKRPARRATSGRNRKAVRHEWRRHMDRQITDVAMQRPLGS